MSEQERQDLTTKKEEENTRIDDATSEQDILVEVSSTQIPTHQANAIKPAVNRDNNNTITTADSDFHAMTDEEADLITKVRTAGDALYELVMLAIHKAKTKSVEKAKEVVTRDINPAAVAAKKDAQDIATLGDSVEGLARTFESLMTEIRKRPYSEQVHLLTGYKKLLKEQISVVDSRIHMANRLK
jgi:hypothetical protein